MPREIDQENDHPLTLFAAHEPYHQSSSEPHDEDVAASRYDTVSIMVNPSDAFTDDDVAALAKANAIVSRIKADRVSRRIGINLFAFASEAEAIG